MALVVGGAAAVQETVADQSAKRIDSPLFLFHADLINVPHDQQRLLGAAAAEPRHEVSAAGYQFEDLGGDSLSRQNRLQVLRASGLITGRVDRVDAEVVGEKADRLLAGRSEVRHGRSVKVSRLPAGRTQDLRNERQDWNQRSHCKQDFHLTFQVHYIPTASVETTFRFRAKWVLFSVTLAITPRKR